MPFPGAVEALHDLRQRGVQRALKALRVLRHGPQDAWMIGNSLIFDIAPATRLGIVSVWIDHRRTGLPTDASCEPDRTITALREIISNE